MKKKYSVDELKQLLSENQVLAGDLGISTYLTCSNSVKVENPKNVRTLFETPIQITKTII